MDIETLASIVDQLAAELLALVQAQSGNVEHIKATAARLTMLRNQLRPPQAARA